MAVMPELVAELAAAVHLPAEALRAATAAPEAVAGPVLAALDAALEAAARGEERSDADTNLLFWGLHVLAHARDPRALPPLLTLLRADGETLDALLGDALTETVPRMLASLYDGDAEALTRIVLDSSADDVARNAVWVALTTLCLDGRIPRETVAALCRRFEAAGAAVEGGEAWRGWEETVAQLGFADLAPLVEAARRDWRLLGTRGDAAWFRETLREAIARPRDRQRLDARYGTLDDPVAALAWTDEGAGGPVRNPFRDVGRNDPCPCGSGKKFKKCCLGAAA